MATSGYAPARTSLAISVTAPIAVKALNLENSSWESVADRNVYASRSDAAHRRIFFAARFRIGAPGKFANAGHQATRRGGVEHTGIIRNANWLPMVLHLDSGMQSFV